MTETIYNNVQLLRQEKDITQEDLGKIVGVSRQTIISIEKGNYIPSLLLAFKLSKFFKQPIDKIFNVKRV